MFTASMPSKVRSAVWNDLKHCAALTLLLDGAVILFDNVVQVFHAPELAVLRRDSLLL
jgi:hypothetical protein